MLQLVKKKVSKGVVKFDKFDLLRSLINFLINISNHPPQANLMVTNPLFKNLMQLAFDTKDLGLLKIVNNVTFFCDPHETMMMKERVPIIRNSIIESFSEKRPDPAVLCEMLGIVSNACLGEKWEGFLNKEFVEIVLQLASGEDDTLRMQALLLVAQVSRSEKSAQIFKVKGVFKAIFSRVRQAAVERDEAMQKLFLAYQLLLQDFSITDFLGEVCLLIDSFLTQEFAQRNVRVVSFLNELLFILQVKYQQEKEIQRLVNKR